MPGSGLPAGFAPHLVHSLRCKAIASARLKNDLVDAAILAQLLRADLLPEAWIAPPEVRQLRALLRHRVALVRLRTCCATGSMPSWPTTVMTGRRPLERPGPGQLHEA
jgi:Transposase